MLSSKKEIQERLIQRFEEYIAWAEGILSGRNTEIITHKQSVFQTDYVLPNDKTFPISISWHKRIIRQVGKKRHYSEYKKRIEAVYCILTNTIDNKGNKHPWIDPQTDIGDLFLLFSGVEMPFVIHWTGSNADSLHWMLKRIESEVLHLKRANHTIFAERPVSVASIMRWHFAQESRGRKPCKHDCDIVEEIICILKG